MARNYDNLQLKWDEVKQATVFEVLDLVEVSIDEDARTEAILIIGGGGALIGNELIEKLSDKNIRLLTEQRIGKNGTK